MMNRFVKFFVVIFSKVAIVTALLASANAATSTMDALTAEQKQAVNQVSTYLNSFTTMKGDFTQISPKGGMTKGVMYISKPGKIRFDYAPPNPFLLVSDGKWVMLKNRSKETGDQFPLTSTPLRLVLAPKIDLLNDTVIQSVEQKDGLTTVALEDQKGSMRGVIVLVYDQANNTLQQWMIIDSKNRKTTVVLENLQPNVAVDPKLFVEKINKIDRSQR